jgi:hypothetical protein
MDWLAIGEPVLVPDAGSASPPHLHNVGYSRPANITYKLDLFCFNDSYRLYFFDWNNTHKFHEQALP